MQLETLFALVEQTLNICIQATATSEAASLLLIKALKQRKNSTKNLREPAKENAKNRRPSHFGFHRHFRLTSQDWII